MKFKRLSCFFSGTYELDIASQKPSRVVVPLLACWVAVQIEFPRFFALWLASQRIPLTYKCLTIICWVLNSESGYVVGLAVGSDLKALEAIYRLSRACISNSKSTLEAAAKPL